MIPSFSQSLDNAKAALLAARAPGGWWEGELSASALSTATAVFALHLFSAGCTSAHAAPEPSQPSDPLSAGDALVHAGPIQVTRSEPATDGSACAEAHPTENLARARELISAGLRWLEKTQNPDGGWGDTTLSKSNISTTVLCWSALRAKSPDTHIDPSVEARCEAWFALHAGGIDSAHLVPAIVARYGKDKTFSVPILTMAALAGRIGDDARAWKYIPQLPFELAAFPQRWFKWMRLPVVSYALPALIAMGLVRHHHYPTRYQLARLLRMFARRRVLALLERIQPPGGGFLEATPLTSFVVMSLVGASARETGHLQQKTRDPVSLPPQFSALSPVVGRGIDFLLCSARPDGSWPIDTNLATWVTTLAINAIAISPDFACLLPEAGKAKLRDWLLAQHYRREHPYTLANAGAWAWTDRPGGVPDADDTPGALLALAHLGRGDPRSIEAAAMGIRWLIDIQNRDGGIPTFCRGWGKLPFDRSSPDLTAHAIRAMLAWRGRIPIDVRKPVQRAVRYLLRQQRGDGSWVPLWFGNQHAPDDLNLTYGTARVLKIIAPLADAKLDVGMAPRSPNVIHAVNYLRTTQNPDGGWGGAADTPSSIEETALAIEALASLPPAESSSTFPRSGAPQFEAPDEIRRGVSWLIDRTRGGTVFPPSPIGFYFAKLWYFEKLYPLIFTVAALESAKPLFAPDSCPPR